MQSALLLSSCRLACRPSSSKRRPAAAAAGPPAWTVRLARPSSRSGSSAGRRRLPIVASLDYVATASDDGVLKLPARTELDIDEIKNVFGYPRNLSEKYYMGRVIGAGSFGVVRVGVEVKTGRHFAIKTVGKVPKRGAPTPRYLLKLRAEVEVMQQLGTSLNAVHLHDVFEDNTAVHMVMELCEGGALLDRIEGKQYSERYIAYLVRSVLRFVAQCHAKGIIYRDIKPDNFLFATKEEDSPLKATDFGLSIRHSANEPKLTSRSGTPAYMAPELVMQCYDEKADIWSVGMMSYQLLTGKLPMGLRARRSSSWTKFPWQQTAEQQAAYIQQEMQQELSKHPECQIHLLDPQTGNKRRRNSYSQGRFPFWEDVRNETLSDVWKAILSQEINWEAKELQVLSRAARDFLEKLLQRNPVVRPSASEALELPWLQDESMAADTPLNGSVVQRLQRFATYTHLKQVVLKMITEEMQQRGQGASLSNVVQELFAAYDKDKSGTLTFEELAQGLKSQGYNVNEAEIRQLMEKMDMDHDGNVQGDEFVATLIDWGVAMQDKEWQQYVDAAFDRMDLNKDGFISLEELLSELPASYLKSGMSVDADSAEDERLAEARKMLREADENGDGRISREEFHNLLRLNQAPDSLSMYDSRLSRAVASAAAAAAS